ncbi:MAG: hypothetical protein ACPG5B_04705 [Chitinophagales bacterium]
MDITIQYKTLFTISFLHDYFADGKLKKMIIEPTIKTRKTLNQHRLIYKVSDNQLSVIAQSNDTKPTIKFSDFFKLTFTLKITEPYFYNYTNVSFKNFRDTAFYFSNTNNNNFQDTLNLSQVIETYQAEKIYHLGSLVSYKGIIFEAIMEAANTIPKKNSKNWQKIEQNIQYVTSNDKVSLAAAPNYSAVANRHIKLLDYAKDTYLEHYHRLEPAIGLCLIKNEQAEAKRVYIDAHINQQRPVGIVEIMHRADISADYALLDKNGDIAYKHFVVRFKNRSTIWRYLVRGQQAEMLEDVSKKYIFNKISNSEFVSQTPIPLSQKPHSHLELELENLQKVRKLPNPSPLRINPINNKIYSNIYLNY